MWKISLVILIVIVTIADAINKPVYKVALAQKGYAQFLQYDVETPPIREFTFCAWVRVFDLSKDQSIFTYVANGNNRVVRLWLDTGGRYAKISIDEKVMSTIPIDFGKDSWRHICLSYQSDHGAWALYIDSRLVSCEAAQSLYSRILPGRGSIIVGYGIADDGVPSGLEGEIFGVNMILSSTIERNYTIKSHPEYQQKLFHKNKVMGNNNVEYIVLGDIKNEKIQKRAKPYYQPPPQLNENKSFIKFKTPYSYFEHDVGQSLSFLDTNSGEISTENQFSDLPSPATVRSTNNDNMNFWKIINEAGNKGKFKTNMNADIAISETQSLPTIPEYETPPPVKPVFKDHHTVSLITPEVDQKTNNIVQISDVETPPPLSKNTKVYGQWTSSQFASSVLNYLKSINFNQRENKKIPPTIPLLKISDAFPYASDIKVNKVRPSFKFQRKSYIDRRLNRYKRDMKSPEINVKILQDGLRHEILKYHTETQAKNVEVTTRGQPMKKKEHRFYRAITSQQSSEDSGSSEEIKPKSLNKVPNLKIKKYTKTHKNNKLLTILPFLKTLEYYIGHIEANNKEKSTSPQDMYSKSLSIGNKWHNVKSYSNDYTPRKINLQSPLQNNIQENIDEANKKLPSIRLKYKPESQKVVVVEDSRIIQGRQLASHVSNQPNNSIDSVSLFKYNHGFLPNHDTKLMSSNKQDRILPGSTTSNIKSTKDNFHKQVKLGNALNEQKVIGYNEKQNKKSFVGGDEKIPDVNRYRSDKDRDSDNVPPSLGPRICKNVELYDRLFYVQPDGSIDVTHILSPVREKNIGIHFIMQNYKKCSLENSELLNSPLLFIDWDKTPVRLFGGAYPKKTTDLCGFF